MFQMLSDESSLLHPKIGDVFLLVFGATCQQGSSGNTLTTEKIEFVNKYICYFHKSNSAKCHCSFDYDYNIDHFDVFIYELFGKYSCFTTITIK